MGSRLAEAIKQRTPWVIRNLSRRVKRRLRQRRDARLSCKDVFTKIYATNAWGGKAGELYSGPGSDEAIGKPYSDAVLAFIGRQGIGSVVDLGCGDFRVGRIIASSGVNYTGVDIVDAVIASNKERYASDSVRFFVKDIIEEELPVGDLCLIREVFQHLSNAQIQQVLPKLKVYKYVIITDYQPPPETFIPNRDKPHGGFTRLHDKSALVLDRPPFNVGGVELFLDLKSTDPLFDPDERIRSFLISH